jgi:hypothetical protein
VLRRGGTANRILWWLLFVANLGSGVFFAFLDPATRLSLLGFALFAVFLLFAYVTLAIAGSA